MVAAVETMAYVGDVPWHRLGVKVDKAMTAAEAIAAAKLNWKVEKRPIYFETKSGGEPTSEFQEVPDKFAMVRLDNELAVGVVGKVYQPLQNIEAFSFFDAVVQEKMAIYHTCGSLWDGAYIWIMAKLPKEVRVLGTDPLQFFTLLVNAHDGSGAVRMRHTSVRVVCWNTLTAALGEHTKHQWSVRHTATMGERVQDARAALGIMTRTADDMLVAAEAMARKKLNAAMVEEFLKGIGMEKKKDESTRAENKRMELLRLIESGLGHNQPSIKNSVWTALNAVTQYVDHNGGEKSDEQKLSSQWFQTGEQLKNDALKTALALVK